jgi:hypothetical protein
VEGREQGVVPVPREAVLPAVRPDATVGVGSFGKVILKVVDEGLAHVLQEQGETTQKHATDCSIYTLHDETPSPDWVVLTGIAGRLIWLPVKGE